MLLAALMLAGSTASAAGFSTASALERVPSGIVRWSSLGM